MKPEAGISVLERGQIGHKVNMHALFLFFLPCLFGRVHRIINFLTTKAEILVLGRGHVRHIVDMNNFYFIFSNVLWGVDQTSWVYSYVDI